MNLEFASTSYRGLHEQSANASTPTFRCHSDGPEECIVRMQLEPRTPDDPLLVLRSSGCRASVTAPNLAREVALGLARGCRLESLGRARSLCLSDLRAANRRA